MLELANVMTNPAFLRIAAVPGSINPGPHLGRSTRAREARVFFEVLFFMRTKHTRVEPHRYDLFDGSGVVGVVLLW